MYAAATAPSDSVEVGLLTCHSIACRISTQPNGSIEITAKLSCPDKSTLYSSSVVGSHWHESVFFGGTALGEIIIWGASSSDATDRTGVIWRKLSGHNVYGVYFLF